MSPIAVEPDFTRRYLEHYNNEVLVKRIQKAFDRVSWEKEFVLCEGSGHAGVGSVFDLSNAQVAKILGAKVVIVSQGGIGRPIDEVSLNQALFQKEGVEVVGVILNKVLEEKLEFVTEFARRGLRRKGLELLGVLPHRPILAKPNMDSIATELHAHRLNPECRSHQIVQHVIVGAATAENAVRHFTRGTLIITPGDREDLIQAAVHVALNSPDNAPSGLVLTDGITPDRDVVESMRRFPFPVLMARNSAYEAASKVHDMIVKTQPADTEKIALIRDMIARYVDVKKILAAL